MKEGDLMKSVSIAFALVCLTSTLYAGDPPPLPKVLPPLISIPVLPPVDPPPRTHPVSALTPDLLAHLNISPWLRDFLAAELQRAQLTTPQKSSVATPDQSLAQVSSLQQKRLSPHVLVTPVGSEVLRSYESSFNHLDQEPAVITNMWSHWYGDEYRTLYSFMRYPAGSGTYSSAGSPVLFVTRGSDQAGTQLPMPNNPYGFAFVSSGDPTVATNLYIYGVKPLRMYVAGTTYDSNWTQVSVWRTDDGGLSTWSLPSTCGDASGLPFSRSTGYLLDKPNIQVSNDPSTLGWVYVVVAKNGGSSEPVIFNFYRSTDGDNFYLTQNPITGDGVVPTTARSASAQVVVDNQNGYVYVFWLDSSTIPGTLYGVRSRDYGNTWEHIAAGVSAGRLIDVDDGHICQVQNGVVTSNDCVEARSMLAAKFNPYSRTVGLTWAAREGGAGSDTDIHFAAYNVDSGAWYVATTGRARSQWAPALDYDNTGNFVLAFYDRLDDPADALFTIYSNKMGPTALPVGDYVRIPTGTISADPSCSNHCDFENTWRFGEYQGLWTLNGYVYSAFFYSPQNAADIYSAYLSLP